MLEVRRVGTLEYPLVTRRKLGRMGGALGYRSHVLFLDLGAGFTGVFSLKTYPAV